MTIELSEMLETAKSEGKLPRITAFNRIDGPGSSLDLREFQEAFWRLPEGPPPDGDEDFAEWSKDLPRTIGITINVGCIVEAHPHEPGKIAIVSKDYGMRQEATPSHIPYARDNWLLKLLDLFALSGVRFELHNLMPGIKSAGLGGSATATTAAALLANALSGAGFDGEQLVALASMIEQDMGVSITGTQEQSNVVFGGVTDYVWFPWGLPGQRSAYGSSVRRTLLHEADYPDLASRIRVFHSGKERASTDVNSVWRDRLREPAGFDLHRRKLRLAYSFREGLRKKDWDRVSYAIRAYADTRMELCADYRTSECLDIQGQCERFDAESFPLGAGGGGAVFVFSPNPDKLLELDAALSKVYRRIDFELRSTGHIMENLLD